MKDANPIARKNDIVVQQLENETLVYDLNINKAFCLNETSALVWSLCDGNRTASEISDEMSRRLKTLISEEFVWIALDQFSKDGLLESETEDRFAGLSRREVIRKVGFASVIALPMVSSLVAPTASMAQSNMLLANNSACTIDSECLSGNCFGGTTCCHATADNNFVPGTSFLTGFGFFPGICDTILGYRPCCSGEASATAIQTGPGVFTGGCRCD